MQVLLLGRLRDRRREAGRTRPRPDPWGRYATGILNKGRGGFGSSVRAVVYGDGAHAMALAQIETQGYFAAYKVGPWGIHEMRNDVATKVAGLKRTKNAVPLMSMGAGAILIDSNHSHGGADTAGVWGGVPNAYLKLIHDRTVAAITEAYASMRPANLYFGTADAGVDGMAKKYPSADPLMTNQFRNDPANQVVDQQLRVIQARDPKTKKVLSTYLNFSAHATVLGGDNTLASGDYTGVVSEKLAQRYGGAGFDQVATLGRSQPARDSCDNKKLKGEAADICKLEGYSNRVVKRVDVAVRAAKPITGSAVVAMHSFMMFDTATNAPIVALEYGGFALGAPLLRAQNPPWFTGPELGTASFSGRIGNLLISGGPGEMYPQIPAEVQALAPAAGHFSIGTAGDFLGYIIAPLGAYPEPIRRSLFDGEPPPNASACEGVPSPVGCPDPIGNDNYFFNVSQTFGVRLTCSLLRGAGDVFGVGLEYWSKDSLCAAFASDTLLPADLDTSFPAQPDVTAVPVLGGSSART